MVNKGEGGEGGTEGGAALRGGERWGHTERIGSTARFGSVEAVGIPLSDPTSAGRRHFSRPRSAGGGEGARSRRWLPENERRETIESVRGVIAIEDETRWKKERGIGKIPRLRLFFLMCNEILYTCVCVRVYSKS